MRLALLAVVAVSVLLSACETGPSGSQSERPVSTAAAAPVVPQESVEARLLKASTFAGTAISQDQSRYPVQVRFTKSGNDLLAQYGSTGQVPAQISGNVVTFKYRYSGRDIEARLTLSDSGELRGTSTGPSRSGGTFRDQWALTAQAQ